RRSPWQRFSNEGARERVRSPSLSCPIAAPGQRYAEDSVPSKWPGSVAQPVSAPAAGAERSCGDCRATGGALRLRVDRNFKEQGELMSFEQNLFISYAHIDDQPLTPGEKGWITRFHATLKAILSMRMGREAKIWRDEKLQGNDVFSDEIVSQFKKSAVL